MNDSLTIAGFMSGTSMDGLDCCIVKISINPESTFFSYDIIAHESFPFNNRTRNKIEQYIGEVDSIKINEIDDFLGREFLRLSKNFLMKNSFDAISLHGQTIHHKNRVKSIQVANPAFMASFFKVPVVYNFRKKDIDCGGTGAPLMPFLDWIIFRGNDNTLTLNLGGISNLSFIPKEADLDDVLGFDVGPGMALIDQCVKRFWSEKYDYNGKYSFKGKVDNSMLEDLITNTPFILEKPPKSTGREEFGEDYIDKVINQYKNLKKVDILRTFVRFSSLIIRINIKKFILSQNVVDRLIISGGGVFHPVLMDDIKKDLEDIPIFNIIDYGIEPKIKESLLMAVLGYSKIKNISSNIPKVTGAYKNIVLGDIYEPK